jgi:hypothetical protein
MERVVCNLAVSGLRREERGGRRYLVAPLTLIVPGVLNGSQGPLLYPLATLEKRVGSWHGIPIVKNHPTDNEGKWVSGKSKQVMDEFCMGLVTNDAVVDGKSAAEAWFDEEATQRVDPVIYNRLLAGEKIEVSTGLSKTTREEALQNATFNGKPYVATVIDYEPDHLAVLPDQVGACSIPDGCGLNNAELGGWPKWAVNLFNYLTTMRKKGAKKPLHDDGTNNSNLDLIPSTGDEDVATRKENTDYLVANCSCWKAKEDQDILNKLSDDKIAQLRTAAETNIKNAELVANFGAAGLSVSREDLEKQLADPSFNGINVANKDGKIAATVVKKEAPANNQQGQAQPMTAEQWYKVAPPEIVNALRHAQQIEQDAKMEVINKLTSGIKDAAQKAAAQASFMIVANGEKGLENLKKLLPLVPADNTQQAPNYLGASLGAPPFTPTVFNAEDDKEPVLGQPTWNFDYALPSKKTG